MPFGNAMKFRHLALMVLFLKLPEEEKKSLLAGNDFAVMGFLDALFQSMITTTSATYVEDWDFLRRNISAHAYRHMRYIGLRTELLIATLLFQKNRDLTPGFGEQMLREFLYLSGDPS